MNQRTAFRNRDQLRKTKLSLHGTPPTKGDKNKFLEGFFLAILPLVIIATLYLFGMGRHDGYLASFGVDSNQFPQSHEQSLMMGSMGLAVSLFKALLLSAPAFFIFICCLSIFTLIYQSFKSIKTRIKKINAAVNKRIGGTWLFKTITSRCPDEDESKPLSDLADKAFNIYIKFAMTMVLCILFFGLVYYVSDDGSSLAKKNKDEFIHGKYVEALEITSSKYPNGIKVIEVSCNSVKCAFWAPKEGTFYLRHEQIESSSVPSMKILTTTEEQTSSKQ
ncbi:hypothetical protein [Aeromonas sp. A600556]|uniref:hypothetical protein n=1 Tax=Aeromonas sp. A600556 TaxID=2712058 RepID=UPI003F8C0689